MQNQNRKIVRHDYTQIGTRMRKPAPPRLTSPVLNSQADGIKIPPSLISQQFEAPDLLQTAAGPAVLQPKASQSPVNMKLFAGLTAITLLAAGVFWFWPAAKKPPTSTSVPNQPPQASAQRVITQTPAVAQASSQTSSNNYHYDAAKKTASYTDTLDASTLFISQHQQASPVDEFYLKMLATGNGGGAEVDTAKGKAFIINTPKTAQQVVLFGSGNYLLVINSSKLVGQSAWISYINSFKIKGPA